MDIREDIEILMLLGRLFLSTTGAMIYVKHGKLTLEVWEYWVPIIQTYKKPYFTEFLLQIQHGWKHT